MKYLIFSLTFTLFASSAAQADPILKLEQYSGYTQPQNAMEAHCSFDQNHVISKISKDRTSGTWGHVTNLDTLISDQDLLQVQTWITEAAEGPFQQGANPCDIGTLKILTENYPLIFSQDCGKRVINLHPSATKIVTWFRQACQLEGKKQ